MKRLFAIVCLLALLLCIALPKTSSAQRVSHCWMWTISRSATILMGITPEIWH